MPWKTAGIGGGVGFGVKHSVFESGLSHQRCRLALHSCRVVVQEINRVKEEVICRIVQMMCLRLQRCGPRLIQTIDGQIGGGEVRVAESASGSSFRPSCAAARALSWSPRAP